MRISFYTRSSKHQAMTEDAIAHLGHSGTNTAGRLAALLQ
jgi:hypothetical protein